MKIAMIGQKQVPSRLGGIEVAVEALAVRMAAEGHEVTLYNCVRCGITKRGKIKRRWDYRGVRIYEVLVPDLKGISAVLGSLAATVRALFGKYDCIHYHAEGPAAMVFLPHLLGIRTVVTIHGLDWKRSKWGGFASWYLKQGEKIAALCSDEIIVLSKSAQKYFRDTYHRDTVMISNGTEKPVRRDACMIEQKWGLKKDEYILYLGRIVPEKGLESLVEAFRQVETEKKLVIAGGISDTKAFHNNLQERAKSDSRVIFTGFVQGDVLDELYSNSYIYCLPSELEGMPISLLEAMSYGNCCLCSDIPECAEVVGEVGFLFEKGNIEELRKSLQKLCEQPELVERSRQQVDHFVFSQYDWDKSTKETIAVYKKRS